MIAIAVDDEALMLGALVAAILSLMMCFKPIWLPRASPSGLL